MGDGHRPSMIHIGPSLIDNMSIEIDRYMIDI